MKSSTDPNKSVRTSTVRKWGNGHGVLLPKAFVDDLDLVQAEMTTERRGSSIVLTKKAPKNPLTLKDLVRGMKKSDRHELVDFGAPRGKEIW